MGNLFECVLDAVSHLKRITVRGNVMRTLAVLYLLHALAYCSEPSFADDATYDILIRNGQIVDGTGNPWFHGNVGIKDDRIVAIGALETSKANHTINATGLVVAPGFSTIFCWLPKRKVILFLMAMGRQSSWIVRRFRSYTMQ